MTPGNAGRGTGPWFKGDARSGQNREIGVSLPPSPKVQKLQAALHAKAKGSPAFRFYALYDKVYRKDILAYAYACCRSNGGAPGVDGRGFAEIESYGVARWLGELAEELRDLSGSCEQSLPSRGYPRSVSASSMVVCQAQGPGSWNLTLPGRIPGPDAGAGEAPVADAQLPVGERMKPCPKAGCGKSARPV